MARVILFLCFSWMIIPVTAFCQADPSSDIIEALRKGNSADLGKHFNEMIDLNIPGSKGSYSKTQASRIVKELFNNMPVSKVTVNKEGDSPDGSKYTMGSLTASGKKYSLYFLLRKSNGEYRIFQLHIQPD